MRARLLLAESSPPQALRIFESGLTSLNYFGASILLNGYWASNKCRPESSMEFVELDSITTPRLNDSAITLLSACFMASPHHLLSFSLFKAFSYAATCVF